MTPLAHPALRLRLEHLLNTAEFQPAGMPPCAILIVHRFEDPLPRSMKPAAWRAAPAWQRAALARLDEFYRAAARPARGDSCDSASAVVFADEAEMIACLALDLARGVASERWWWRTIRRGLPTDPAEAIASAWLRRPRYVPAALSLVVEWGETSRILALLAPHRALAILEAVVREFGLPRVDLAGAAPAALAAAFPARGVAGGLAPLGRPHRDETGTDAGMPVRPISEAVRQAEASSFGRGPEPDPQLDSPAAVAPSAPPWAETAFARDIPDSLPPEHQALAGTTLMLARTPTLVRRSDFSPKLSAWYRAMKPAREFTTPREDPARLSGASLRTPEPAPASLASSRHEPAQPRRAAPVVRAIPVERQIVPVPLEQPRDAVSRPPADRERAWYGADGAVIDRSEARHRIGTDPSVRAPAAPSVYSGCVDTGLAGVLFLVNPLGSLGLLGGPPFARDVGAWAWLEFVGRRLVGPEHAYDPLWRWMAACDGRDPGTEAAPDFGGEEQAASALLADLGTRLGEALELIPGETLPSVLFVFPAHVHHTRTHVDVVLPLDCASVRIRRAGLDANPGWVPELGRIFQFHFSSGGCQ